MADAFPDDGQHVGDDEWIERVSAEGWVALTKDTALVRDHADALAASTLRVFALPNANLTGPEMAERFQANLNRIVQRPRTPPFQGGNTGSNPVGGAHASTPGRGRCGP